MDASSGPPVLRPRRRCWVAPPRRRFLSPPPPTLSAPPLVHAAVEFGTAMGPTAAGSGRGGSELQRWEPDQARIRRRQARGDGPTRAYFQDASAMAATPADVKEILRVCASVVPSPSSSAHIRGQGARCGGGELPRCSHGVRGGGRGRGAEAMEGAQSPQPNRRMAAAASRTRTSSASTTGSVSPCTPTRTARTEAAGRVTTESSEKGRERGGGVWSRPRRVSNHRAWSRGEPSSIVGFLHGCDLPGPIIHSYATGERWKVSDLSWRAHLKVMALLFRLLYPSIPRDP